MMHSFVFDGDEQKDFIRGLGVRFDRAAARSAARPPRAVRRRRQRPPGPRRCADSPACGATRARPSSRPSSRAGRVRPSARGPTRGRCSSRLEYIPAWGDYTLVQSAANAFEIRKRTQPGFGWVGVDQGGRAAGVGYVGGATGGGVVFGLRDFWQRHPTQLDIRGAHTDAAEVTLWLWSPEAPAMDLRFYHDVMGMETYEKQYDGGLEITYEDYEPGWGDAPWHRAHERDHALGAGRHAVARRGSSSWPAPCGPRRSSPAPRRTSSGRASSADCGACPTAPRRPGPRSRTGSTGSSTITDGRSSSATGTASGTTATSCTPTTATATCGGTTSAASRGTTPSSRPTSGSGTPSCAPAAPTSSASPKP